MACFEPERKTDVKRRGVALRAALSFLIAASLPFVVPPAVGEAHAASVRTLTRTTTIPKTSAPPKTTVKPKSSAPGRANVAIGSSFAKPAGNASSRLALSKRPTSIVGKENAVLTPYWLIPVYIQGDGCVEDDTKEKEDEATDGSLPLSK